MRHKIGCGLLLILAFLSACQPKVIINYYAVPSLAPGTRPEMNTAGFWIGRHPDPDAVIMTDQDIVDFNGYIKKKTKAVHDVLTLSDSRDGRALERSLRKMLAQNQGYVGGDGTMMTKEFIRDMEALMGVDRIPSTITAHWAYVVRPCDQRLLPTAKPFYKSESDTAIDRLQNSALDAATPLLVLIESADHMWVYAISANSEGWVLADNIALCPKDEMARYEAWTTFVVATDAKADIYADPWLRQYQTYIQMGVRLAVLKEWDNGVIQVLVPVRSDGGWCTFDAAFVSASQVHRGNLSYTPRNAIVQAFKLLNAPYGWGGMYGEQDCSRFIQEVFATMGITLPRNSAQQGKVGRLIASFTKSNSLDDRQRKLSMSAMGGITTLQFPGHIMLFLGSIDGVPYAIHDLYAFTEPAPPNERLVPINRVVVSSLAIGEGTKKGSLLMRLGNVREISSEPQAN
ncbi:MAG: SH3 domain-containing protein [Desulfomonilia bacterium]